MRKKFNSKKRKKSKIKYLLYLVVIYIIYQMIIGVITTVKLTNNNEEFLKALIKDSNHHTIYETNTKNIVNRIANFLANVDFNNPLSIIEKSFGLDASAKTDKASLVYNDDYYDISELEKISQHISDPYPVDIKNPRVYIYNSHQLETYSSKNLEIYNIKPNVMMASYLLKDKLNKLGIPSVAEEANLIEFMRVNGWAHKDSYKASRFYIIDTINKYSSLDLLIDIHRDALTKEASTVTIGGKKYAKTLFVVGLENKNHKENLTLTNKINDIINKKYPGLSRGVLKKQGAGVDGIYNQDISPKMILLEIGGQENSIDEVLNTVEAISIVLKEYLGE